jgi:hypothetical protein
MTVLPAMELLIQVNWSGIIGSIKAASCRKKAHRTSSKELRHFYYSYSLLECFPG